MSTKIFRKSELDGYLLVDHTASPGVKPEEAIVGNKRFLAVGEGKKLEAATRTCSHCNRVVIINPERKRERANCFQCDHFICDECGIDYNITGTCKSFKRRAEEYLESVVKGYTGPFQP